MLTQWAGQAADLEHTATQLRQLARSRSPIPALADAVTHHVAGWVDQARRRQEHLEAEALKSFEAIAAVEDTLVSAAAALTQLTGWAELVRRTLPADSPLIAQLHQLVAELGHELDEACAHHIDIATDLLCPNPDPTTRVGLADFGTVSAAHIDAINRQTLQHSALPEAMREVVAAQDVQVLEAGATTAVMAIGDIDTAPAVITIVHGVGSADPARWAGNLDRARHLATLSGAAVVSWFGYHAPPTVLAGIAHDPADTAGRAINDFQQALRARRPDARLVLVGHSYGSVVAGQAASRAADPLAADAIIFAGSPGVGVPNAAELHATPGGSVIASLGTRDAIGVVSGIHGPDPTSAAFAADTVPIAGGHSDYFEDPDFVQAVVDSTKRPPH
ncbi:alpha/beta fold hydrolase [Corynebacterium aquilae]|uniref:alpha/beta fold hydrolase n=1 Tax=Corynebacterium aquilae TaxID=203263 RepID=UPI000952723D|nr:alpha/beta hydrolase [Corynebacterium aquilae]